MKAEEFYNKQWSSEKLVKEDLEIQEMRKEAIAYSYKLLGDIRGKKCLEIGCGAGFQTEELFEKGANITAIDFSLKSVEHTRKQLGERAEVKQMNAENLDFSEESFDLIYINSVLMHVNKEKVLIECQRVLKKGGKLVVVEPLKYSLFLMPYRLLFSEYKKMKPSYMTLSLFKKYQKLFSGFKYKPFYLVSTLKLPLFSLRKKGLVKCFNKVLKKTDNLLVPLLEDLSWIAVVQYVK